MNYPYSTAPKTIPKILAKIQTVGQPTKLDKDWMSSIGFNKTSEQRMIAILKFLGFAQKDGAPTEKWLKFRSNKTGKKVLGQAIKSAYLELYNTYPKAHEIEKDELKDFFITKTSAGKLALNHTVNTFRELAEYAEFDNIEEENLSKEEWDIFNVGNKIEFKRSESFSLVKRRTAEFLKIIQPEILRYQKED